MSTDSLTLTPSQLAVFRLEKFISQFPQAEMVTESEFCAGVYARTLKIPAGVILTGKIHSKESFFVVRQGRLLLSTGEKATLVEPPFMAVTKAGDKRIGIAVTDCIVTTFHANPDELRTEDDILEFYTVPEPDNLLEIIEKAALEAGV